MLSRGAATTVSETAGVALHGMTLFAEPEPLLETASGDMQRATARVWVATGGMAIGDEWLPRSRGGEAWHDVCVRIEGPVAADFACVFELRWEEAGGLARPQGYDTADAYPDLRLLAEMPRRPTILVHHLEANLNSPGIVLADELNVHVSRPYSSHDWPRCSPTTFGYRRRSLAHDRPGRARCTRRSRGR